MADSIPKGGGGSAATVGVLTFAAPAADALPEVLRPLVGTEPLGHLAASALPIALDRRLRLHLGVAASALNLGGGGTAEGGRLRLPAPPLDPARCADLGRAVGLKRLVIGELATGGAMTLALKVLDCERRRAVAGREFAFTDGDLRPLFAAAVRFLALEAGLAPQAGEEQLAADAANGDAFVSYLRALHLLQLVDDQQRPVQVEAILQHLTSALVEDPDHQDAAFELMQVASEFVRPHERDWLRALAPDLIAAGCRTRPERGDVVFALVGTLSHVVETALMLPLLERPLGERHELRRRLLLATLLGHVGRPADAIAAAREAVAQSPDAADAHASLAQRLEAQGGAAADEARGHWRRALELDADQPEALAAEFRHRADDDPAGALALAPKLFTAGTHAVAPVVGRIADLAADHPDAARAALAETVARSRVAEGSDPALAAAFGRLLEALGERARAELHYLIALEQGLRPADLARTRALLERPGAFAFAAAAARAAELAEGDDIVAAQTAVATLGAEAGAGSLLGPLLAGRLHERRGDFTAARDLYLSALQRSGHAGEFLLALGRVERELGELDASLRHLEAAAAKWRHDAVAQLELARTCAAAGRRDAAMELVARVLAHLPGLAEAQALRAELLLHSSRAAGR